jgi:tetratricopeptide (TPR) repeat protein
VSGDIQLEISSGTGAGNYEVRVVHSAAGGEPTGTLGLDVDELLAMREILETTLLSSTVQQRSMPVHEQPVRDVGQELFQALFRGPVLGVYRASLVAAQRDATRLRVVLRLMAPELASVPWEMLFDPETETYLCRAEPLVRHVAAPFIPDPPLQVPAPIRILGVASSPKGLPPLDVDMEQAHLKEALAGPIADGLVELVWEPKATFDGIHRRLLSGKWHVLHFVGHGDYDRSTSEGALTLVRANGQPDRVEASRIADLLGQAQPALRLVVLNSCESGRTSRDDLFSGTAATLARRGVNAVAAMQFAISDAAAIAFARSFYTAIAHGRSVDEAARSGRIGILGVSSLEWATPVLYLRGEAAQLFALTNTGGGRSVQLPVHDRAAEGRRREELRALDYEAREELRLEHFGTAVAVFDDLLALDPEYPEAAELKDTARLGLQLARLYTQAMAAEEAGNWGEAIQKYDQVLDTDPAFRDTAAKKEECQTKLRVVRLQIKLRRHADAGRWRDVLDVTEELANLDPNSPDFEGLASRARAVLSTQQQLEYYHGRASAAEGRDDWAAAARSYDEILKIEPQNHDIKACRDICWKRHRTVELQSEIALQAASRHWSRFLVTKRELARLNRIAADCSPYDKLSSWALRDLAAGWAQPLFSINSFWGFKVTAICWYPAGSWIAVARKAGAVHIYDVSAAGKPAMRSIRIGAMFDSPHAMAFSQDGQFIAISYKFGKAGIWDLKSKRRTLTIPESPAALAVVFSPDSRRLATANGSNARLWRADRGDQLLSIQHDQPVRMMAFSPDGRQLVTVSGLSVRVWSVSSGQQQFEIQHDETVTAIALSPDGPRLAVASGTNVCFLAMDSGHHLLDFRHDISVCAMEFSPDGSQLATASTDFNVRIWDAISSYELVTIRHHGAVAEVAFSRDGTALATACAGKVLVW